MITITDKRSGELIDFPTDTPEQVVAAYLQAREYEKMAERLKTKLKPLLPNIVDEQGRSPEVNGYILKSYQSQRMNYNMSALRDVFDEDTISLFVKPQKGLIDAYLKEHRLEQEEAAILKRGLEPDGVVIDSFKTEKVA